MASRCPPVATRCSLANNHEIVVDSSAPPSSSPLSNYGTAIEQENGRISRRTSSSYSRFLDCPLKTDIRHESSNYRCCFGLVHVRRASVLIAGVKILLLFAVFCRQLTRTVEIYNYTALQRHNKERNEKSEAEFLLSNVSLEATAQTDSDFGITSSTNRNQSRTGKKFVHLSCVSSLLSVEDGNGDLVRRTPEDALPILISTSFFSYEFLAALSLYWGLWRRRWRWLQWHIDLHLVSAVVCLLVVALLIAVFVLTFTSKFTYYASEDGDDWNRKPRLISLYDETSSTKSRRLCTFFHRHIAFGTYEANVRTGLEHLEKCQSQVEKDENDQEFETQETRVTRATIGILIILVSAYIAAELWSFYTVRACQRYLKLRQRYVRSQWPPRGGRVKNGRIALTNMRRRASSHDSPLINADSPRATTIFGGVHPDEDSEALLPSTSLGDVLSHCKSPVLSTGLEATVEHAVVDGRCGDRIAGAFLTDGAMSDDSGSMGDDEADDLVANTSNSNGGVQTHYNQSAYDSCSENSKSSL